MYVQRMGMLEGVRLRQWGVFMDSVRRCGGVVSVDTEATHLVPPVMVQVATSEVILIELVGKGGLSGEMKRLLEDKEIRKVFCDYEADEKCLGVRVENVVDIQSMYDKSRKVSMNDLIKVFVSPRIYKTKRYSKYVFSQLTEESRYEVDRWLDDFVVYYSAADVFFIFYDNLFDGF
jgi:hypothetical protein